MGLRRPQAAAASGQALCGRCPGGGLAEVSHRLNIELPVFGRPCQCPIIKKEKMMDPRTRSRMRLCKYGHIGARGTQLWFAFPSHDATVCVCVCVCVEMFRIVREPRIITISAPAAFRHSPEAGPELEMLTFPINFSLKLFIFSSGCLPSLSGSRTRTRNAYISY